MTSQVHATCVDLSGVGVLLRGPSGSGKSDLALRLMDGGASLVADDRVDLEVRDGALIATAPANLAGLIEVRGMGIMAVEAIPRTALALVIDLTDLRRLERLPEPMRCNLLGVELPCLSMAAETASAAAKVRLAAEGALRFALKHALAS